MKAFEQSFDPAEPVVHLCNLRVDLLLKVLLDEERCKLCGKESEQAYAKDHDAGADGSPG